MGRLPSVLTIIPQEVNLGTLGPGEEGERDFLHKECRFGKPAMVHRGAGWMDTERISETIRCGWAES